jgi:hypothetical protein
MEFEANGAQILLRMAIGVASGVEVMSCGVGFLPRILDFLGLGVDFWAEQRVPMFPHPDFKQL